MVALLRPQPQLSLRQEAPRQLRLVVDDGQLVVPSADHRLSRRSARPATKSAVVADPGMVMLVAVVAFLVLGGLMAVRASQGGPVANTWAGVNAANGVTVPNGVGTSSAVRTAAPGDQIIVAQAGDSLWSIAEGLAPESDPRPAVALLIELNGDDSLQIGQQILVPEQLLD